MRYGFNLVRCYVQEMPLIGYSVQSRIDCTRVWLVAIAAQIPLWFIHNGKLQHVSRIVNQDVSKYLTRRLLFFISASMNIAVVENLIVT
jgi:hypothetical protein